MTALCHQPHPTQHAPSKLPRRHTRGYLFTPPQSKANQPL